MISNPFQFKPTNTPEPKKSLGELFAPPAPNQVDLGGTMPPMPTLPTQAQATLPNLVAPMERRTDFFTNQFPNLINQNALNNAGQGPLNNFTNRLNTGPSIRDIQNAFRQRRIQASQGLYGRPVAAAPTGLNFRSY